MWLRICRTCEVHREQTRRLGRPLRLRVVWVMVTPVLAQVSASRLANNATDDGNWLMYWVHTARSAFRRSIGFQPTTSAG